MSIRRRKKTNPHKIPVKMTEADIRKLAGDISTNAIMDIYTIFFCTLRDKWGFNTEQLQQLYSDCDDVADSLEKKYCTLADMRNSLKEENDIVFTGRKFV